MRGGEDHLPGGKKALAAFVKGTIRTVSWATRESCIGGGRGQKKWVDGRGVQGMEERERVEGWVDRIGRVIHL